MSDADALAATEQARSLVANPRPWGIPPRAGLEPLDVSVKFNRAAKNTNSAFQVVVQMKITLDNGATWRTESALVGQGRTKGEALEMFYNWMADENAMTMFHDVVRAADTAKVDVLAQAELAKKRAEDIDKNKRTNEATTTWLEKKFDWMGRKAGVIEKKIQTP